MRNLGWFALASLSWVAFTILSGCTTEHSIAPPDYYVTWYLDRPTLYLGVPYSVAVKDYGVNVGVDEACRADVTRNSIVLSAC